uniref:SGNH hydrolase-type esterase domain-containing protein n=1 Tax=Cacopsylla melanoneura TaxID=428564 RepID=A0A8D9F5B0_9HEMI
MAVKMTDGTSEGGNGKLTLTYGVSHTHNRKSDINGQTHSTSSIQLCASPAPNTQLQTQIPAGQVDTPVMRGNLTATPNLTRYTLGVPTTITASNSCPNITINEPLLLNTPVTQYTYLDLKKQINGLINVICDKQIMNDERQKELEEKQKQIADQQRETDEKQREIQSLKKKVEEDEEIIFRATASIRALEEKSKVDDFAYKEMKATYNMKIQEQENEINRILCETDRIIATKNSAIDSLKAEIMQVRKMYETQDNEQEKQDGKKKITNSKEKRIELDRNPASLSLETEILQCKTITNTTISSTRSNIKIIGDSHVRNLKDLLQKEISSNCEIQTLFKPGGTYQDIADLISGEDDKCEHVFIMAGTNDIHKSTWDQVENAIYKISSLLKNTKISLIMVPPRGNKTIINRDIKVFNKSVREVAYKLNNVNCVEIGYLFDCNDYLYDNLHLNRTGKLKLCKKIVHSMKVNIDKNDHRKITSDYKYNMRYKTHYDKSYYSNKQYHNNKRYYSNPDRYQRHNERHKTYNNTWTKSALHNPRQTDKVFQSKNAVTNHTASSPAGNQTDKITRTNENNRKSVQWLDCQPNTSFTNTDQSNFTESNVELSLSILSNLDDSFFT